MRISIFIFLGLIFLSSIATCTMESLKISVIKGKVISVEERISTENKKIITVHTITFQHQNGEIEVLESRDNLLKGKFNNIELINTLKTKVNQEITLEVSGYRKNIIFDYRNVLKII